MDIKELLLQQDPKLAEGDSTPAAVDQPAASEKPKLNVKALQQKAREMGYIVNHDPSNREFMVYKRGEQPGGDSTYFTDDIDDAHGTMLHMAKKSGVQLSEEDSAMVGSGFQKRFSSPKSAFGGDKKSENVGGFTKITQSKPKTAELAEGDGTGSTDKFLVDQDSHYSDPFKAGLNRKMLQYAAGRNITCPNCQNIMDWADTVNIDYEHNGQHGNLSLCGKCADSRLPVVANDPSVQGAKWDIVDGRVLSGKRSPAMAAHNYIKGATPSAPKGPDPEQYNLGLSESAKLSEPPAHTDHRDHIEDYGHCGKCDKSMSKKFSVGDYVRVECKSCGAKGWMNSSKDRNTGKKKEPAQKRGNQGEHSK